MKIFLLILPIIFGACAMKKIKSCNKACEPYQVAICDEHYVTCKGRTGISLHQTEED